MEDINKRLALYKEALKDYQLALIPLVKYFNNTDFGFCHYFKETYNINVFKLPEMIQLKTEHNIDNAYWFGQSKIIPRIKFLKDVINITDQKINPDKYLKCEKKIYLPFKWHRINVYEGSIDGKILETCIENINVKYMVRIEHVFDTWTTYSFNTYFKNGLMIMDMIPSQPFSSTNMFMHFPTDYYTKKN